MPFSLKAIAEGPRLTRMSDITCTKTNYGGWPNCLLLTNGLLELVATTDVGPRIIRCALKDGDNVFFNAPADLGKTGGDQWRPYGGHRLWHAPEAKPRSYAPDNSPIEHEWDGQVLTLREPTESSTGIEKQIAIRISADKATAEITHTLINHGTWDVDLAAWALSVMAPGGRAILPQEPFIPFPQKLTPARPLVLWNYTNMSDPRFTWGEKLIQLRQDPTAKNPQKFGTVTTLGWGAYENKGTVFLKYARHNPDAAYPDFGCSWEVYTNPAMLELETLSPLQKLRPGDSVGHVERWSVRKVPLATDETDILQKLEPAIKELRDGNL